MMRKTMDEPVRNFRCRVEAALPSVSPDTAAAIFKASSVLAAILLNGHPPR